MDVDNVLLAYVMTSLFLMSFCLECLCRALWGGYVPALCVCCEVRGNKMMSEFKTKSFLMTSFTWLGVKTSSLCTVLEMPYAALLEQEMLFFSFKNVQKHVN